MRMSKSKNVSNDNQDHYFPEEEKGDLFREQY